MTNSPRVSFRPQYDLGPSVAADQRAMAHQLSLCHLARGRWSVLVSVAGRSWEFAASRIVSVLVACTMVIGTTVPGIG